MVDAHGLGPCQATGGGSSPLPGTMNIILVDKYISRDVLRDLAKEFYVDMVKGVVDVEREVLALGGEWHMDANNFLIENGSLQKNIWGFNIYLDGRIEYISLINIRPLQNNRTLEVEDPVLRDKMSVIIKRFIQ